MPRTAPKTVTLILLTAVSISVLNMFLPSLPSIASDLDVSYAVASLSVGGFLAISGALSLIMGPLSDRLGRRPVMLWGFALFTAASIGCALADNILVFLIFRMIQGASGVGSILSRTIIRDMYDTRAAASLIGYVSMVMALVPMLAPLLGGVLEEWLGWRSVFYTYAVAGAIMLIWAYIDVGETNKDPSPTFRAQFRTYPTLLRSGAFWSYSGCTALAAGTFYIFLGGAPIAAQIAFDLSPAWLGLGLGCTTAGFVIGNYFTGRFAKRTSLPALMTAGRLITLAGLGAGLLILLTVIEHPVVFFAAVVSIGIGNGLTLPTGNTGSMSVNPKLAGSAAGLSGAFQLAAGAALSALAGWLISGQAALYTLMALLLLSTLASLVPALHLLWLERRKEQEFA